MPVSAPLLTNSCQRSSCSWCWCSAVTAPPRPHYLSPLSYLATLGSDNTRRTFLLITPPRVTLTECFRLVIATLGKGGRTN